MSTVLAASFSYADIALLALILLGGIIGLIFGFHSTFKGIFLTIAIILCSTLLLGVAFNGIRGMDASMKLEGKLLEKTATWGEAFNEPIYISEDGSFFVLKQIDGETKQVALENSLGNGITDGIKGKFVLKLASWFIKEDGKTLSGLAAEELTSIIITIIAFVAFCIGFGILAAILRAVFKKFNESQSSSLHWLDRIFGFVIKMCLTFIFAMVVLAILHSILPKLSSTTVLDYINNSTICGYLYNNNPVSNIFSSIFG